MADRNSIIEKIKALLSKTTENGCTEAEMLSSLAKASAMMDTYDMTDADVQIAKDEAAMLHADPPDLQVVVQDAAIKAFMKDHDIHLETCRASRSSNVNETARAAGHAAGDRASFGRPVTGTAGVMTIGR
jgi:hypothetical protein